MVDATKVIEDYIKGKVWLVRENANLGYSFSSLFMRLASEGITEYTLKRIYPKEISGAHLNGDFHLHNLQMGIVAYCAGWSISDILLKGFGGPFGKVESFPAKHFSTALLQLANFIGTLQNEWAGAQAFNSLDTLLAPFVYYDKLSYEEVKQGMQQFVYNLNISSRWGGQSPFVNCTFDISPPKDLIDQPVIIGGKTTKDTYGDFQDEMDEINRAFLEIMYAGDAKQRTFTFPLPTYNITKNFDWNSEIADLLFEVCGKYGIAYFQNFVKSELDPKEIRAMCCRLLLDLRQHYRRLGGFFGFADKTGSIGVVTINMPRIGFLAKNDEEFFERLEKLMELAKESLEIKRKIVQKNIDEGLLPFTKIYLGTLRWHFSTIGIIGMHESCLNFLGEGIASKEGKRFAIKVLKFMRSKLIEFQKETGNIYNLEATPAEGTSYRLAALDKQKYPKIVTAGEKVPYYTNSTWLPVNWTDDIFEALKHQDELQCLYTGGTVFHGFVGERISGDACKTLVRKIVANFRLPYFTITPTFSICPSHGYISGEHFKCPKCGKEAEVYSRVVGYYRPIQQWHIGKQEEFRQRLEYKL